MKTAIDSHHIVELHLAGLKTEDIVKFDRCSIGTARREIRLYEDELSKDAVYGSMAKSVMQRNGLHARHCNVCDKDTVQDCHIQVVSGRTVPRIGDLSYICNRCIKDLA